MEHNTTRTRRAPSWQQGFGDGLAQATSMVVTPLLFVLLGVFVDRRLGTGPFVAIALGVFSVVGMFVVTYYDYRAKMERAEAGKPWTRRDEREHA